jgi:hypothetical protein
MYFSLCVHGVLCGEGVTRWWRRAFVAAAVGWAFVLLVAPLAARQPDASGVTLAFAYVAYNIGHLVCHQLPERSFQLMSVPLPVCARCTGIYAGAALAALAGAAWRRADGRGLVRAVLIAAALPTLVTLVYEWATGDMPSHWVRAASGAPLGAALAWILRDVN